MQTLTLLYQCCINLTINDMDKQNIEFFDGVKTSDRFQAYGVL